MVPAQGVGAPAARVEQVDVLLALFVGTGVGEYPSVPWKVGGMTIARKNIWSKSFHRSGRIFDQVEPALVRRLPAPYQQVVGVPPDEMRRPAVRLEQLQPTSVGVDGRCK